jgi:hypothetical protein
MRRRDGVDWDGVIKLLAPLGVSAAFGAWYGGYLGGLLPPLPRLVRALRNTVLGWWNQHAHITDDGRYHLVLCGREGDGGREGTLRLLRGALNPHDYPMLRLSLSATCIGLCLWHVRKDTTAGVQRAGRVLRAWGADAVLWGEVPKQGNSLRSFLRVAAGETQRSVARSYNVDQATISRLPP